MIVNSTDATKFLDGNEFHYRKQLIAAVSNQVFLLIKQCALNMPD